MSGRGRGRGAKQSFSKEQLSTLGITNNEVLPGPVTQPPPLYPLLDRKPVPLTPSIEHDYMLILRQDFIDRMHLSGAYLRMPESNLTYSEHEIDKLVAQLPSAKEKFDWNLFPTELRPKITGKRSKKKVVQEVDIETRLIKLEKLEAETGKTDTTTKAPVDEDAEGELEIQEEDEEMDDGTDYANNYFDNGEAYDDEDDNLDDGPIY